MSHGKELRPVIISMFGPPALACIRSWGRHGFHVGMVCIRSEKQSRPDSRYLKDYVSIHPSDLYTPKGIEIIKSFLEEFHASGILAINEDLTCWLSECMRSSNCKIPVWAPPNETIHFMLSKQRQIEVARSVGFDLLPTYMVDRRMETVDAIPDIHFPLCLRPDDPRGVYPSFKVRLVDSRSELIDFLFQIETLDKPLVGQPFVNSPNLVVHGARTIRGKPIGLQAFIVEHKFQGVTLTIRPFPLEDTLRQRCIEFVDALGLTGNYHFEFLLDPTSGKSHFLEINGRLGGTTAKVYACGYDEPMLALECYGVCETSPKPIRNLVASSKHALLKHIGYAIRDRLSRMDYPNKPRSLKILHGLYGILRYKDDVLTSSDIRGSIAFCRALLTTHT